MEQIKITTIEELFDTATEENVAELSADLFNMMMCFIDLKNKYPGISIKCFDFTPDGKGDISFKKYDR